MSDEKKPSAGGLRGSSGRPDGTAVGSATFADAKPFNSPFGGLGGLREALPQGPSEEVKRKALAPARAVVRIERKGRRGKEVTVIEHLELEVKHRDEWLKALKGALGCGGAVEGVALVLQGDQRERAAKWLEQRGVKKVTVS